MPWGTDGMSPNNGDPERQHRHVTPAPCHSLEGDIELRRLHEAHREQPDHRLSSLGGVVLDGMLRGLRNDCDPSSAQGCRRREGKATPDGTASHVPRADAGSTIRTSSPDGRRSHGTERRG